MKVEMIKSPTGALVPADDEARELLAGIAPGASVFVEMTRPRNAKFHRKFMAMLRFGFDHWSPVIDGVRLPDSAKNFEHFRGSVLRLAGFFDTVADLHGGLVIRPKSISFASMDEVEFERVYRKCLSVLWHNIFVGGKYKSEEELRTVLDRLLQFE